MNGSDDAGLERDCGTDKGAFSPCQRQNERSGDALRKSVSVIDSLNAIDCGCG